MKRDANNDSFCSKTFTITNTLYVSSKITMETAALPELVSYLTEVCSSLEREMAYKYKLTM
jgi:hypothetical protein